MTHILWFVLVHVSEQGFIQTAPCTRCVTALLMLMQGRNNTWACGLRQGAHRSAGRLCVK